VDNDMRVGISIGSAYYDGSNWEDLVELVKAADRIGVHSAWSAEAWGMESTTPLAYLAALTSNIKLGTGIMQITARTPSMAAMTALTLARISHDRFILGLGVSGPQVVEGLHGASFAKPLSRLREYIDVVRQGLSGERIAIEGEHYVLPRPGGEGKSLRLSMSANPGIPIYLATLGPKMLELTGELADGWLGTSFIAEAGDVFTDHLKIGATKAGRTMEDLDLQVTANIEVSDDVDELINRYRPSAAFTLGAMGSAQTNYYNAAYSRAGFAEMAAEVQSLWVAGKKAEAISAVTDEFVLKTSMIGTEEMVKQRIHKTAEAGINTLRVAPVGATSDEQIGNLEYLFDLIDSATHS
jgi:F420-dependent oxidoreductase-like protein